MPASTAWRLAACWLRCSSERGSGWAVNMGGPMEPFGWSDWYGMGWSGHEQDDGDESEAEQQVEAEARRGQ